MLQISPISRLMIALQIPLQAASSLGSKAGRWLSCFLAVPFALALPAAYSVNAGRGCVTSSAPLESFYDEATETPGVLARLFVARCLCLLVLLLLSQAHTAPAPGGVDVRMVPCGALPETGFPPPQSADVSTALPPTRPALLPVLPLNCLLVPEASLAPAGQWHDQHPPFAAQ